MGKGVIAQHADTLFVFPDRHQRAPKRRANDLKTDYEAHCKERPSRKVAVGGIRKIYPPHDALRRLDDKPLIAARVLSEIENGEVPRLREHQCDDHECHADCAQREQGQSCGDSRACQDTHQDRRRGR